MSSQNGGNPENDLRFDLWGQYPPSLFISSLSDEYKRYGVSVLFAPFVLQRLRQFQQDDPQEYYAGLAQLAKNGAPMRQLESAVAVTALDQEVLSQSWESPLAWDEMVKREYPLRQWLIKGLIPSGMTIIGGAPKAAKSYIAYDILMATVGQGLALGHFGCQPGNALYLAIEDDEQDTKERVFQIRKGVKESIPGLHFVNALRVPTISEGLYDYLIHFTKKLDLSLIVVDPLMYIYDVPVSKSKDQFREIKDTLLPFRQFARESSIHLVFVDHMRKSSKEDVDIFQTLYGSVAKAAIADSLIMVQRNEEEVALFTRGRSIKEQALYFTFVHDEDDDMLRWAFQGEGDQYTSASLQRKILKAFADAGREGMRALDVKGVIDWAELIQSRGVQDSVRQTLFKMYKRGSLLRTDRGFFALANDHDDRGVVL